MARATHLTISTADRIRLDGRCTGDQEDREDGENEVRQEVQVSVTYSLDPGDTDLTALAEEKAGEVQRAHEAAWNRIGAFGGNHFGGSTSVCTCRRHNVASADEEDENEEDEHEEGDEPDDGLQGDGMPFDPPPLDPPMGGRYLPDASRFRNGTGSPEPPPAPGLPPDLTPTAEPLTGPQKILIRSRAGKIGLSARDLDALLYQQFKVWRLERLSKAQAASLLDALERNLKDRQAKDRQAKDREAKDGDTKRSAEGNPLQPATA